MMGVVRKKGFVGGGKDPWRRLSTPPASVPRSCNGGSPALALVGVVLVPCATSILIRCCSDRIGPPPIWRAFRGKPVRDHITSPRSLKTDNTLRFMIRKLGRQPGRALRYHCRGNRNLYARGDRRGSVQPHVPRRPRHAYMPPGSQFVADFRDPPRLLGGSSALPSAAG